MQIKNMIRDKSSNIFIIAELSANHNGNLETAIETIRAAKRAGADCIKFQTYTADTLTIDSDKDDFVIKGTLWDGRNLYSLYKEAYTPWEWHDKLFKIAKEEGLSVFSTPFDITAVDFLESLDVTAYKIASFEITDLPLIAYVASKNKPLIISTGIATLEDIELAISACHKVGNYDITLLQCTSSYPANIEDANLIMIKKLSEKFNVKSGLSDHTMGIVAPIVATTLGATVIEKHFILDRSIGGPDAAFSLNEFEFTEMVKAVRDTEKSIGKGDFKNDTTKIKGREFSRSLYIVENVKAGDIVTMTNVRSIRPGFGLHPKHLPFVLNKKFNKNFEKGTRFDLSCISSD
jgi:pseudaminic acid synthase